MKGKHIPKAELKVGMVVVCGDNNVCWRFEGKAIPFKITDIHAIGIARVGLNGEVPDYSHGYCKCSDLDHLYEWVVEDQIKGYGGGGTGTNWGELVIEKRKEEKSGRKFVVMDYNQVGVRLNPNGDCGYCGARESNIIASEKFSICHSCIRQLYKLLP